MEVMVLHQPRLLVLPRVNDQRVTGQIAQIRVRVIAVVILDDDVGKERVNGALLLGYVETPHQLIVRQIVDKESRGCLLLGKAEDVDDAGVEDPETIALIRADAERRDDLREETVAVLMRVPRGEGRQWW